MFRKRMQHPQKKKSGTHMNVQHSHKNNSPMSSCDIFGSGMMKAVKEQNKTLRNFTETRDKT